METELVIWPTFFLSIPFCCEEKLQHKKLGQKRGTSAPVRTVEVSVGRYSVSTVRSLELLIFPDFLRVSVKQL